MRTLTEALGRRFVTGLAILVSTTLAVTWLVVARTSRSGAHLTAEFPRAGQGLGDTSPVKIRGVPVGGVAKVELTPAGRALVTLRINHGVKVPDSVTASVEPESVFGPRFVNLVPGEHEGSGPYLADGGRITRTNAARDLSDLLGDAHGVVAALDPGKVTVIIGTLAEGLVNSGDDLRGIVAHIAKLGQTAGADPNSVNNAIKSLGRLTGTVRGTDAVRFSGDINTLVPALAAGKDRVGRISDELTQLAAVGTHGLSKHGTDIREGFRSAERVAVLFYAQLGVGGDAVRALNMTLPFWRRLTTSPGGGNKHAVNVQLFLPTNPCALILGLCPGSTSGGR